MFNPPRPPPSLFPSSSNMNPPHLRIFCVNDVYKPERFSQLKTLCALHKSSTVPESNNLTPPPHPTVTKLVLPGDFLGGSMFAAVHSGASVIDILNQLGVDYFTLGNHEFDFGSDQVKVLMDQVNNSLFLSLLCDRESKYHSTLTIDMSCHIYPLDTWLGSLSHTNPTKTLHCILIIPHPPLYNSRFRLSSEQLPVARFQCP